MFSYRHAFHAGNHADVLKHLVLLSTVRHLTQKDTALQFIDTHAGAGLYRLDDRLAQTSTEAQDGLLRLAHRVLPPKRTGVSATPEAWAPALLDYLALVKSFNPDGGWNHYPGSPFILQSQLRPRDRLKLFELHPTDSRGLTANIAQLESGRQIAVLREDGFAGIKQFLPPPQRRGLVLCDPSYELKSDYQHVMRMMNDALTRFATGTYLVWYPIIARLDAQALPRKLYQLARRSRRAWLHASLSIGAMPLQGDAPAPANLRASGVFVINPPHTLYGALQEALPQVAQCLAQGASAGSALDAGEA